MKSTTLLPLLAGLLVTVATSTASASNVSCLPDAVSTSGDNGGQFGLRCASNPNIWYIGSVNFGTPRSQELLNTWLSMTQAALLSGKYLTIYYSMYSQHFVIDSIILNK